MSGIFLPFQTTFLFSRSFSLLKHLHSDKCPIHKHWSDLRLQMKSSEKDEPYRISQNIKLFFMSLGGFLIARCQLYLDITEGRSGIYLTFLFLLARFSKKWCFICVFIRQIIPVPCQKHYWTAPNFTQTCDPNMSTVFMFYQIENNYSLFVNTMFQVTVITSCKHGKMFLYFEKRKCKDQRQMLYLSSTKKLYLNY